MVTVARERAISNSEKLQLGRNWESADHASEQAKLLLATGKCSNVNDHNAI
jgi:hypothetical protein